MNRILVLAAALCAGVASPGWASEQKARCIYADFTAGSAGTDGPCAVEDVDAAAGVKAYAISWVGTPDLRVKVVLVGQVRAGRQPATMDGRPGTGFELANGLYVLVTEDKSAMLVIEGR